MNLLSTESTYLLHLFACWLKQVPPDAPPEGFSYPQFTAVTFRSGLSNMILGALTMLREPFSFDYSLWKNNVIKTVSNEFYRRESMFMLLDYMEKNNCPLIIIKGVVISNNYPKPEYRVSVDIDAIYAGSTPETALDLLRNYGFEVNYDIKDHHYICKKPGIGILELHTQLFNHGYSENWLGSVNVADYIHLTSIPVEIEGRTIHSLAHTDHFLYIVLHSFKHFMSVGSNFRMMADTIIFAHANAGDIDWARAYKLLDELSLRQFVMTLFTIGEKHLLLDMAKIPGYEAVMESMTEALINDLFDTTERQDYSAISNSLFFGLSQKTLKKIYSSKFRYILHYMFSKNNFSAPRYSYLKKRAWLLPVAWIHRIFYNLFARKKKTTLLNESKLARHQFSEHVELLKKLKVIK